MKEPPPWPPVTPKPGLTINKGPKAWVPGKILGSQVLQQAQSVTLAKPKPELIILDPQNDGSGSGGGANLPINKPATPIYPATPEYPTPIYTNPNVKKVTTPNTPSPTGSTKTPEYPTPTYAPTAPAYQPQPTYYPPTPIYAPAATPPTPTYQPQSPYSTIPQSIPIYAPYANIIQPQAPAYQSSPLMQGIPSAMSSGGMIPPMDLVSIPGVPYTPPSSSPPIMTGGGSMGPTMPYSPTANVEPIKFPPLSDGKLAALLPATLPEFYAVGAQSASRPMDVSLPGTGITVPSPTTVIAAIEAQREKEKQDKAAKEELERQQREEIFGMPKNVAIVTAVVGAAVVSGLIVFAISRKK